MDVPRTRRAEQSEATRGALVDAARALFAEHGYGQVGTEQIVDAARLTRGALYYHFEDKRDLFRAVFTAADADLVKGIADVAFAEEDPWQRLVKGCDAFLDASLDPSLRRAAGRSVLAHLIDLAGRGIVACDGAATVDAHYRLRGTAPSA